MPQTPDLPAVCSGGLCQGQLRRRVRRSIGRTHSSACSVHWHTFLRVCAANECACAITVTAHQLPHAHLLLAHQHSTRTHSITWQFPRHIFRWWASYSSSHRKSLKNVKKQKHLNNVFFVHAGDPPNHPGVERDNHSKAIDHAAGFARKCLITVD